LASWSDDEDGGHLCFLFFWLWFLLLFASALAFHFVFVPRSLYPPRFDPVSLPALLLAFRFLFFAPAIFPAMKFTVYFVDAIIGRPSAPDIGTHPTASKISFLAPEFII
jgi:hypothetical protein